MTDTISVHAQGIVRRDIKPDNCLINEDNVLKIVDFGVSEMFEKESDMTTAKSAGSPAFMPPEPPSNTAGSMHNGAAGPTPAQLASFVAEQQKWTPTSPGAWDNPPTVSTKPMNGKQQHTQPAAPTSYTPVLVSGTV